MQNIIYHAKAEQSELIEGLIQSGDYKTKEDVIDAALKLLNGQAHAKQNRLGRLIDEGINSGDAVVVDKDKLLREIRSRQNV